MLVLLPIIMTSCSLAKLCKEMQAERFSLDYHTDIRHLIDIDGAFFPERENFLLSNFLFFEDGSCGAVFFPGNDFYPDIEDPQVYPGMDLQKSLQTWGKKPSFFDTGGIYTLHNDTIEADQYVQYLFHWVIRKYWFKVVDRNTLLLFQEDWDFGSPTDPKPRNNLYHFVPATSLPSSKGIAIKKKKWMWHDKKEWKQYKRTLK